MHAINLNEIPYLVLWAKSSFTVILFFFMTLKHVESQKAKEHCFKYAKKYFLHHFLAK